MSLQKDTVSKVVISLKFASHDLFLSFLKNHHAHLFCNGCLTAISFDISGSFLLSSPTVYKTKERKLFSAISGLLAF